MKQTHYLLGLLTIIPFQNTLANSKSSSQVPPNVVLVMTDDQGYGDLRCHGNPIIQTPHIDNLYEDAIRFTNFHVNATSAPTRSALMTGRYARRVGVWHTVMGRSFLRRGETTMAEVFAANGYQTGMFGKWHLGDNYPLRPIDRGFNEMVLINGGSCTQMDDYWDNDRMNDHYNHNGKWEKYEGFSADALFNAAFSFMKKSKDIKKPFFVYLPVSEPHGPCNTLSEWDKPYLDAGLDKDLANFFATITRVDYNMGRLEQFLKENKLDKNTIVIFMTDNGSASAAHYFNAGMRGGKGSMYEGGHRVPFFIKLPKKYQGISTSPREIPTLAAHIDVLPTLAEICGLEYSFTNKLDGKSLVPLLKKEQQWEDRIIFLDQQRRQYPRKDLVYNMMTEEWRFVNGKELYEIKKDPSQKNNVYAEHPDIVKKLKAQYDAYWKEFAEYDEKDYFTRTIVGTEQQKETCLSAIDLFLENSKALIVGQADVRTAKNTNGCWFIEVAEDGLYEFELCRWPKESGKGIRESIKAVSSEENDIQLNRYGEKPEGVALDVVRARLSVNEHDVSREVRAEDRSVIFTLPMKKGNATVRSWFFDSKDNEHCVYYLYIRKMTKTL